jgi:hypothetical protein
MSFTTLITPAGKYEYIVNGDQARITFWALKGCKGFSQSTSCSTEHAKLHWNRHQKTALF